MPTLDIGGKPVIEISQEVADSLLAVSDQKLGFLEAETEADQCFSPSLRESEWRYSVTLEIGFRRTVKIGGIHGGLPIGMFS